jgi:hypothetical protein
MKAGTELRDNELRRNELVTDTAAIQECGEIESLSAMCFIGVVLQWW